MFETLNFFLSFSTGEGGENAEAVDPLPLPLPFLGRKT